MSDGVASRKKGKTGTREQCYVQRVSRGKKDRGAGKDELRRMGPKAQRRLETAARELQATLFGDAGFTCNGEAPRKAIKRKEKKATTSTRTGRQSKRRVRETCSRSMMVVRKLSRLGVVICFTLKKMS